MTVFVCCRATMIGDLLCSALIAAGHDVGARFLTADQITDLKPKTSVVIHINDVSSSEIRRIRQVRAMSPESPVIVLCNGEIAKIARNRLGLDVDAVIPDDQSMTLVTSTLVVVQAGFKIYHRSQVNDYRNDTAHLRSETSAQSARPKALTNGKLSKREVAILARLLDGFSNKEIANALGIADTTVKVHVRSIFQKTGVKNRTQAAIWASENLTEH